mmetsp:Transcript_8899/g.17569  ORF Transcript_8899/g.17569 Transcript_8899/m.17569 type:complete len:91 (-) Transcript_8899:49-321(-)
MTSRRARGHNGQVLLLKLKVFENELTPNSTSSSVEAAHIFRTLTRKKRYEAAFKPRVRLLGAAWTRGAAKEAARKGLTELVILAVSERRW